MAQSCCLFVCLFVLLCFALFCFVLFCLFVCLFVCLIWMQRVAQFDAASLCLGHHYAVCLSDSGGCD